METLQRFRIPIIVVALLVIEAIFFMILFSGRSPTVDEAENTSTNSAANDLREVRLNEAVDPFQVNNTTNPGLPMRVDFDVIVLVDKDDEEPFREIYDRSKHRVREAVIEVVRQADIDQIRQGDLTEIKNQLVREVSQIIGPEKGYIKGVVIPDFKPYEL